jgi:hypothetical protein
MDITEKLKYMEFKQEELTNQLAQHGENIRALKQKLNTTFDKRSSASCFDTPAPNKKKFAAKSLKSDAQIKKWVKATLSNGAINSITYNELAKQAGISDYKLDFANRQLVTKYKDVSASSAAGWQWFTKLKKGQE